MTVWEIEPLGQCLPGPDSWEGKVFGDESGLWLEETESN